MGIHCTFKLTCLKSVWTGSHQWPCTHSGPILKGIELAVKRLVFRGMYHTYTYIMYVMHGDVFILTYVNCMTVHMYFCLSEHKASPLGFPYQVRWKIFRRSSG